MRSLANARRRGGELRALLGLDPHNLAARLQDHLFREYGIEVVAFSPQQLNGSTAEINPAAGVLKYDSTLGEEERVLVFAHELGHLVLHARLQRALEAPPDPVWASAYADAGVGALARYSPRTAEEAEASAFALEFVCPSLEAFRHWESDARATSRSIATAFRVPVDAARAQLAQGLYEQVMGAAHESDPKSTIKALTPQQHAASRVTGRPTLIDAGPGTGKTATLVARLQFLCGEMGASPDQCLVLTFSNDAAAELRERLAAALGQDAAAAMTIATFHGFGVALLHHHGHRIGLAAKFSILDQDAQLELVETLLGRVPCERLLTWRDPAWTARQVATHINHCKQRLRDPDALEEAIAALSPTAEEEELERARELLALFRAYETEKVARGVVDFADLIMLPRNLLADHPDIALATRERYRWVLVDEFQDVTRATGGLLRQLCGEGNPPWVVGDARQAIYRFLGAAPENVTDFQADFPGAEVFELEENFRSAPAIVGAANQLAHCLAQDAEGKACTKSVASRDRWRAAGAYLPFGKRPLIVAKAISDYAERVGVAEQVGAWLASGEIPPGDIAILARRNVDVRNLVLTLGDHGIKAQASGLLTAEGAAGAIAAILGAIDDARGGIPRLVWAIRDGDHTTADLNAAVAHLLSPADARPSPSPAVLGIANQVSAILEGLAGAANRDDAFALLTALLFDTGVILRPALAMAGTADGMLTLTEIVSTLALAVGYRASHVGMPPTEARIGFAERLRKQLSEAVATPLVPARRMDTVRVMTCHASKGLEFPCVVIAGQSAPKPRDDFAWLPPGWRPQHDDDLAQSDALLFVGVTRAQRAAVVSYAERAGESPRASRREPTRLLGQWIEAAQVPVTEWKSQRSASPESVYSAIWAGAVPKTLRLTTLENGSWCPLRTYLEEYLGLRFRERVRPLYPTFVAVTRRILRQVAEHIHSTGATPTANEIDSLLGASWPEAELGTHPHAALYRSASTRMARAFAQSYAPLGRGAELLDPGEPLTPKDEAPSLRLDLVAHARQPNGRVLAVGFRVESLAADAKNGVIIWSRLTSPKRLAFVLMGGETSRIDPYVFSGADGLCYRYQWSQRPDSRTKERDGALGQYRAYQARQFAAQAEEYHCSRCPVRVSCPYWTGVPASTPPALPG